MTSWTSVISAQDYLDNNSDPMIRIGSPSWKIDGNLRSHYSVTLPNRIEVDFNYHEPNFGRDGFDQYQSTLLWIHSMGHIPQLLGTTDNRTIIVDLLGKYASFMQTEQWKLLSSKMTSLDHCVAMRIRSMCMVAAQFASNESLIPDVVLSILTRDLKWAEQTKHYAQNNHGMMLAAAVIHAGNITPFLVNQDLEILAESQIESIVLNAFDSKWVCRENTPTYQAFYINFCKDMLSFLRDADKLSTFSSTLSKMIEPATKTLQTMLLPNGDYPPMGDSGSGTSGLTSVDGTILSEESGIFVEKSNGVYRSFKCGFSSMVHKHADDSSITLSIDNDELLMDGGLHSYDYSNPYTLAVKSQRGHSGLFFPQFDLLYSGTLFDPRTMRQSSRLERIDSLSTETHLVGEYSIDKSHFARRVVKFANNRIVINDSYSVTGDSTEIALQRFLVPANSEITLSSGELQVRTKRSWMTIEFDPLREAIFRSGLDDPIPMGWISRKWGERVPCMAIDIKPRTGWFMLEAVINYGRV